MQYEVLLPSGRTILVIDNNPILKNESVYVTPLYISAPSETGRKLTLKDQP